MTSTELPRPEVRDVVSVAVAEAELAAVQKLLDELLDDVREEERAADAAELRAAGAPPIAQPEIEAIELSRQIVERMRAARGVELDVAEDDAIRAAEARVAEASRLADALAAAAHRDATELIDARGGLAHLAPPPVATQLSWRAREADLPHWPGEAETAPVAPSTPPWVEPLPALQHWAEPAPAVLPAAAARPESAADAHEQFWREEAQAAARATGISPIEVLLPTAALLLLLVAVLVLIG